MRFTMTMRAALEDPEIFGTVLPGESWAAWRVVLIAANGEPLTDDERAIFAELTGREREPDEPCDEVWGVVGRRGGKTRAFAVAAVYRALLVDYTDCNLAPGQRFRLPVIAAVKEQAVQAFQYILGIIQEVPMFAQELMGEPTQDTIRLSNRIDIVVTAANFKTVRGPTLIACICDEIAFWRIEGHANPDKEILRSIRPGLATTGGPLLVMSSPYAKKGILFETYKENFGPDGDPRVLVLQAPTLRMNSSLPRLRRDVEKAYRDDPESAKAEYGAQFRDGISDFVSPEVVDACTDFGVAERAPEPGITYRAFVDPSGGTGKDAFTLAIAHEVKDPKTKKRTQILDLVRAIKPPFSPSGACEQYAEILNKYRLHQVTGDNYADEWPKEMMRANGISYEKSDKVKNAIYGAFLPLLNSQSVRLLDHPEMRRELVNLERSTSQMGRDTINHPNNGHDDLINAAAGALLECQTKRNIWEDIIGDPNSEEDKAAWRAIEWQQRLGGYGSW
ncbi:hypothetical protein [Methylorubrum suomiense]|uniref:Terminase n=1 Tax=Methylorubrum suomiense TaxID=144191 RepID=A0ABQ4UY42_9HYPH|nr:hypothetical protein [Methylorubrum suomiense]GJE77246.1 hypothetical protein BGCPKDLD_3849 [Methylorubrum suomiense]